MIRAEQVKRIRRNGLYLTLIILGIFFSFPLLFMIVSSFKPDNQTFYDLRSLRAFMPIGSLSFDNYITIFLNSKFLLLYLNSVFITASTVGSGLIVNSLLGYVLARLKFKGKKILIIAVVTLLITPFESLAIPMFMLVSKLPWFSFDNGFHIINTWLNSYRVQIIPFIANALFIFLFYQNFRDIPKDFDEAAYLDGANPWQVYTKIIIPMSIPSFITVTILHSLAMWNQYMWPSITTTSQEVRPVMVGLSIFTSASGGTDNYWGATMAYATMITLPVLLIFLFFQRYFIQSVMSSGIKG